MSEPAQPQRRNEYLITDADNWKPRFFSVWGGQALSLFGSALTQFVLLWWITTTTGSASALAIAGIAALLPQALLSPIAGTLADRWSRRLIMIGADTVTALSTLALVVLFATGTIQVWQVYVAMFIRSCMQAFQQPAAGASTPMLVPQNWIPRVTGWNQTVYGLMTIAGAPLGALTLAFLPIQGALLIDTATALIGITPLFFFKIPQIPAPSPETSSVLGELEAGVQYVTGNRGMLILFAVMGLVALTVLPTFTMTPLLVTQAFGGGVNDAALMEGLSGAGIIIGGIIISIWTGFHRRVVTAMLFFAIAFITVTLTALMPRDRILLAALWWFIGSATWAMGNAPFTALLLIVVPNQMQGRVLALLNTVVGLAGPVGLAIAGPLGDLIGIRGVFIAGGLLSTIVCAAALFSPALMRLEDSPAITSSTTPDSQGA
jgi:DHA3 family macrolide efflux protein-like MFS transporter